MPRSLTLPRVFMLLCLFSLSLKQATAQRLVGVDTLYGNEWLESVDDALKMMAVEEGIYRVTQADLLAAGWTNVSGSELGIMRLGQSTHSYVTSESAWGPNDYLEFYVSVDDFIAYEAELYNTQPSQLLNPRMLMSGDSLPYFLVKQNAAPLRYEVLPNPQAGTTLDTVNTLWAAHEVRSDASVFAKKDFDPNGAEYSSFRPHEGFALLSSRSGQLHRFQLPDRVADSEALLELRTLSNWSTADHNREVLLEDVAIDNRTLSNSAFANDTFDLGNFSQVGPLIDIRINGLGGSADRYSVGALQMLYIANFQVAANQYQRLSGPSIRSLAVDLAALPAGADYRIYLPQTGQYTTARATNTAVALGSLPAWTKLSISATNQARTPVISQPRFANLPTGQADYLILTSEKLRDWQVSPSTYRSFRETALGGSHTVATLEAEDLYDTFGYGFNLDARALRNAIQHTHREMGIKQVLIIGKGREFITTRYPAQLASPDLQGLHVPTLGLPGSDNLMAINFITNQAPVAIGRVSAEASEELGFALTKARAVATARRNPQTIAGKAWMNRIVHMGGGSDAAEQLRLKLALERMASALAATEFGPNMVEFYKDSDQPVQQVESDELFEAINDGASFITFFGHSSAGTFDFNIDNPDNYENAGRLPFMMSLGCYAGNMHKAGKSAGERFLLISDEATAAFGASSGLGFPGNLELFATQVYQAYGDVDAQYSIGQCLQQAINQGLNTGSFRQVQLCEQYTLHGDPAIDYYRFEEPDYAPDANSFVADRAQLTFGADSFQVNFDIYNLGRNAIDSLYVIIDRKTNAMPRQTIDTLIITERFGASTTLSYKFESWLDDGVGLNELFIRVEAAGSIEEGPMPGAFANNAVGPLTFFVQSNGADALWPRDLMKIHPDSTQLYVATRTPFGEAIAVTSELSETRDFDQIFHTETRSGRGLMSFELPQNLPSDVYWRISAPSGDSSLFAKTINFSTTDAPSVNSTWSVSNQAQLARGLDQGLFPDDQGNWQVGSTGFFMRLTNRLRSGSEPARFARDFQAAGSGIFGRFYPGIIVAIAQANTGEFVSSADPRVRGATSAVFSTPVLSYRTNDSTSVSNLIHLLTTVPQPGDVVWVWDSQTPSPGIDPNFGDIDSTEVGDLTFAAALTALGASKAYDWTSNTDRLYNFIVKVGGEVIDETIADFDQVIVRNAFVETDSKLGIYRTPVITDAQAFYEAKFATAVDSLVYTGQVTLLGITANNGTVRLDSSLATTGTFDLAAYTPAAYPALAMELRSAVDDTLAVPRLTLAEITYQPVPELAFDTETLLELPTDSILAGAELSMKFSVRNVSPTPIQLATTTFSFVGNAGYAQSTDTLGQLPAWGSSISALELPSRQQANEVQLLVALSTNAQPEYNTSNNLGTTNISVLRDAMAPTTTVYLNGELPKPGVNLVSDPVFEIRTADNGIYDSLGIQSLELSLKLDNGILLSGVTLPGTVTSLSRSESGGIVKNVFSYDPGAIPDGTYTLQVRVRDESANKASVENVVRFEIDRRTAVSNLLPYPNPFVDRVRFQYELTGTPPDDYRVSIYSTSGRLVRELGPMDLGALTVGKGLTEGHWDGTNAYGQALAKGVYLYRIAYSFPEGADLSDTHRETQLDEWIKSGFGKLVKL